MDALDACGIVKGELSRRGMGSIRIVVLGNELVARDNQNRAKGLPEAIFGAVRRSESVDAFRSECGHRGLLWPVRPPAAARTL